ncbi:MAG: nucleotide-diphospho-sugar transferase, partial [Nanoarchaeota archaeon]|nr:nucleotide-diphospho-sugar transferase [Nanoarchaeota archaeon]
MLERYKDDDRIMHIGGNNFQRGWRRERYSYYFSDYPFVWGWASWSRAWKKFDAEMKSYLILRRKGYFSDAFPYRPLRNYIFRLMNYSYYKDKSGWDNNWIFTIFTNNGLSIVPNENLVRNIGFMENSVRTKKIDSFLSIPRKELGFPLKHPPFMIKDRVSDKRYYRWLLKFKLKKYFLKKTGLHKLI